MTRGWSPWSMAALGLVFVMATALVTGLVVANWSGSSQETDLRRQAPTASRQWQSTRTVGVKPAAAPIAPGGPAAVAIPTAEAVQACNQRATDELDEPGRPEDAVKTEELAGSLHGLNESKQNDEKYRAAYARCMRARGYVAG
jgi:hypothetical protein